MATDPYQRLLTADEFLRIDWGSDVKAELDRGVVRMMAGGSRAHDRVQTNVVAFLRPALRGSGCRPSGSDMGVRTNAGSVRYPAVRVPCGPAGPADDASRAVDDPCVLVEILSPSTAALDRGVKLDEYRALASVDTILLVDPEAERVRVVQRTGRDPDGWSDVDHIRPHDVPLPALGVTIPHAEMFARD